MYIAFISCGHRLVPLAQVLLSGVVCWIGINILKKRLLS